MLITQRQNQWVVEINVVLEDGFNIFIDARYNWAKHAGGEVTMQTFDVSLGNVIKKFDVFSI